MTAPMNQPMPALFVGHGNPMNALERNRYSSAWEALGRALPRPRGILAVSAHWYIGGCRVTALSAPRTIHDFGGFPRALYEVSYPAPGSPELAGRVRGLLAPHPVEPDLDWGIDHGVWSVLVHLYPAADIPVVQLSIDRSQPPVFHHELGKLLAPLRDEGILVLGSGNIVHNLQAYQWGNPQAPPYDWAATFEEEVRQRILAGHDRSLADYWQLGRPAQLSAPTPDHYLPLLYVLGTRRGNDGVTFPVTGIEGGSLSMLAVQLGR